MLSPPLTVLVPLFQHNLPAHQPELHFAVGMQACMLVIGLWMVTSPLLMTRIRSYRYGKNIWLWCDVPVAPIPFNFRSAGGT